MRDDDDLSKTLDRAFLTALLLSGSTEIAERAVLDGIAALEFKQISADTLLRESVKSAIRQLARFRDHIAKTVSALPLELARVLLLGPKERSCFVLRMLLGMSPGTCSELLDLQMQELDLALRAGMQALPLLEVGALTQRAKGGRYARSEATHGH
jgi:DNA-directed RNA polymerase specialized sigma24 family protein